MINIIVAVADNNVIGKNNQLLWHIPEDLQRFKKLTTGFPVIMGRKTFESIMLSLHKPLPDRKNVVITRQKDYQVPEGVQVFGDLQSALDILAKEEVFIIGGAQIYKQALPLADRLYVTQVKGKYDGDAFFPEISNAKWRLVNEEEYDDFSFFVYDKK